VQASTMLEVILQVFLQQEYFVRIPSCQQSQQSKSSIYILGLPCLFVMLVRTPRTEQCRRDLKSDRNPRLIPAPSSLRRQWTNTESKVLLCLKASVGSDSLTMCRRPVQASNTGYLLFTYRLVSQAKSREHTTFPAT
jgi:hypothetical protein